MSVAIAVVAGLLIGLSLGALGGGGSILTVPVLVYGLGQSAHQATTGSLVIVGITSLAGAVTAYRNGKALLTQGIAFGVVAMGGAAAGATAAGLVPAPVLLAAFAGLLLVVAGVMITRQVRARSRSGQSAAPLSQIDDPIITFSPSFACNCPRALKVLATATVVGLLTGFLGVGGGFLVVPALTLALRLPMACAVGTSLVVITITSASSLAVRVGGGTHPAWDLIALLTIAAVAGSWAGARLAARADARKLQTAFTALLVLVAGYTAARALPALS